MAQSVVDLLSPDFMDFIEALIQHKMRKQRESLLESSEPDTKQMILMLRDPHDTFDPEISLPKSRPIGMV